MNCFNHNDQVAIGVCFVCGKALCKECYGENEVVFVCKSSPVCQRRAQLATMNLDQINVAYKNANKRIKNSSLIAVFIGVLFVGLGGYLYMDSEGVSNPFSYFSFVLGVLFLVSGILQIFSKKVYPEVEEKNDE